MFVIKKVEKMLLLKYFNKHVQSDKFPNFYKHTSSSVKVSTCLTLGKEKNDKSLFEMEVFSSLFYSGSLASHRKTEP